MSGKVPVNIRRNVDSYNDPYIESRSLPENSWCTRCRAVFTSGRWYLKDQFPGKKFPTDASLRTVCPACQKARDKAPGGVVRVTGEFATQHKEEIRNLIHNENRKARSVNPLERIISIQSSNSVIEVSTTNEKLAQRIGRALYKAYSGSVEYKWSEDTKIARVNWHR